MYLTLRVYEYSTMKTTAYCSDQDGKFDNLPQLGPEHDTEIGVAVPRDLVQAYADVIAECLQRLLPPLTESGSKA